MKSNMAFLLGTAAVLAVAGPVQAAPASPLPAAQSYADLLESVDNANDVLLADDLAQANRPRPLLQLAQWHHHHHRYHHHHHHHGFFPGFGITVAPPAYYDGGDCYYRRQVYINRWGERVVRRVRVCD